MHSSRNIYNTPQKRLQIPEGWGGGSIKLKTLMKDMYMYMYEA